MHWGPILSNGNDTDTVRYGVAKGRNEAPMASNLTGNSSLWVANIAALQVKSNPLFLCHISSTHSYIFRRRMHLVAAGFSQRVHTHTRALRTSLERKNDEPVKLFCLWILRCWSCKSLCFQRQQSIPISSSTCCRLSSSVLFLPRRLLCWPGRLGKRYCRWAFYFYFTST